MWLFGKLQVYLTKMKFFLTASICLFAQVFCSAQIISGIIKDLKGNLVEYVNVTLKLTLDSSFITGTVADSAGNYTISNVKTGNYFISASQIGYILFNSKTFQYVEGENLKQDLQLNG